MNPEERAEHWRLARKVAQREIRLERNQRLAKKDRMMRAVVREDKRLLNDALVALTVQARAMLDAARSVEQILQDRSDALDASLLGSFLEAAQDWAHRLNADLLDDPAGDEQYFADRQDSENAERWAQFKLDVEAGKVEKIAEKLFLIFASIRQDLHGELELPPFPKLDPPTLE
ncbi:MAG: hypothetical protein U0517_03920 [Candidatus Andersenbacteria bacterium]